MIFLVNRNAFLFGTLVCRHTSNTPFESMLIQPLRERLELTMQTLCNVLCNRPYDVY